jgi:LysR family transcriptional regulator for bpeEF and oprC
MRLPKATVSTLIRDLETALSVKLLNRTTRQISLTTDGAAYYERCLNILADVRDAEESLAKSRASPSGRLRVDVPTLPGRGLLIAALPDFFARYPGISIEVGFSDRTVDLIEEGVDCALRGGELMDSTLIARRVGLVYFVTCAAPSYLEKHGRPTHPQDLMQHECINYFSAKTGRMFEWDFARQGERIQIKAPGRIAVNDGHAYLDACRAGVGIGQLSLWAAEPYLESGVLEQVLDDWCVDPLPLHVVYPQNRHLSAKVRVFVEWLAELLATQPSLQAQVYKCPQSATTKRLPTGELGSKSGALG